MNQNHISIANFNRPQLELYESYEADSKWDLKPFFMAFDPILNQLRIIHIAQVETD